MLSAISMRLWPYIAAIGAALAVVAGAFLRGRQSGIDAARARAAEDEQQARRAGDAAAADAERAGADELLRRGRF